MKKAEFVYREILYSAIEKKNRNLTQSYLAAALKISLSTVNLALKPLVRMNAVRIRKMGFDAIDPKKILYYWASIRNIEKDIIFSTRVAEPVKSIEKQMPDDAVFTAFSAYKFKYRDVPADYSEVYVYGSDSIRKRWPQNSNAPNLFVLKKDSSIDKYGKTATTANLFVDLWNLRQWYAKDFLNALEAKIGRILE
ncbi:winged helix-turn-helix transcriptional regulator [Candidatus Woesearchaeota archaeon]|nr:winged helix-turn-helix transcriptional regulator [Candidatus Woesearchaeota archaeon]